MTTGAARLIVTINGLNNHTYLLSGGMEEAMSIMGDIWELLMEPPEEFITIDNPWIHYRVGLVASVAFSIQGSIELEVEFNEKLQGDNKPPGLIEASRRNR